MQGGTFLSKEEIEDLTGAVHLDKQVEWLEANGFRYLLSHRNKHVIILRTHLNEMLSNAEVKSDHTNV